MSINRLILQNLKANLKHYYLYVFALIFSVALYFAFVTLQYDPALDEAEGTVKGAAAIRAGSVLLVVIVAIFNLYANNIFVKRRSKEIGLLQLIGLTKSKIFRILSTENFMLYFGSLAVGAFAGFSVSKLLLMILFQVTGVDAVATLQFSRQALIQTILVFACIYVLLMLVNYLFIKRQTILSLFRVSSSTETKIKRLSVWEFLLGTLGLAMIVFGYYVSSQLFGGRFTTINELFGAMVSILASVIIGTYLFYKGTVRLVFNVIRKRKRGFLKVSEVLSLSTVMFRMKSNALLLTIITTVSALSIGLLALSYISYYSAEKSAVNNVPAHFSIPVAEDASRFASALSEQSIPYRETRIEVYQVYADLSGVIGIDGGDLLTDPQEMVMPVVSERDVPGVDVSPDQAVFTGYNDLLNKFMSLKDSGNISLKGTGEPIPLRYDEFRKEFIVSWHFTSGGVPTAIVDETVFERLKQQHDPEMQRNANMYIGIDISKESMLQEANDLYHKLGIGENSMNDSRIDYVKEQKQTMGLIMFIVGFLGLTFLITSGCILYFKQMDESAEEQPSYTILRKLGFTGSDLLKGIRLKQAFNFGIPLAVGLVHSYFAVQSGWFLFGTELWTPMFIVMGVYTVLYSIFAVLSVLHYKQVIRRAL